MTRTRWWRFWSPESGIVGGVLFGVAVLFVVPPVWFVITRWWRLWEGLLG